MINQDITFFATTNFRNQYRDFGIRRKDRRQHMYVIGKTGVGKTALLKNMALQDIQRGEGMAIVDPHGEFVEEVLEQIPSSRTNDVVYFNPADTEYPISFNILEMPDPKYRHLVVSGLIGVFTKIWANVWSARMEYILSNCILALVDTPGTTLLGILRLLVDRDYRQRIINNVQDPVVKSFWINEYEQWRDQYRNEAIAPIQNKVGQFLNVALVRNIVGQPKSTINIPEIMDTGKILLVNVSKGRVGEDNSALLGAMLITKIQLAAMERVRISEEQRKDFFLYVDEFQNFATESFAAILSEARKYRLNLILAHQYVGQLVTDTTTKVRDAIFGNVGTLVTFRVGANDAEFLEMEFTPEFEVQDLVNLPNYNIYLRLMVDGVTSRPFSAKTLPPLALNEEKTNRDNIIKASRDRYARTKAEVERRIAQWSGVLEFPANAPAIPSASGLYDAKCSTCSKAIKVTFAPEPGRPIYCKPCLKKVEQEREKTPLKRDTKPKQTITEYHAELGKLGIEFGSESQISSPVVKPEPFAKAAELKNKIPSPISLDEALHRESQPVRKTQKKKVNLADLRKALQESLNDNGQKQDEDGGEEGKAAENSPGYQAEAGQDKIGKDTDEGDWRDEEKEMERKKI